VVTKKKMYVYPPAFDLIARTYSFEDEPELVEMKIKELAKKLLDGNKVSILIENKRVLISWINDEVLMENI